MPDVSVVSGPGGLTAAVRRVFSDEGPLAGAFPGFEVREAQRDMAVAVADTLEQGGVLLAEAGTGTGKTLAYLLPAILSGRRVLISTGTKNLQEQIYFKDLPLVRRVIGGGFRAAYMKGRGNYLCLHRFEQFRAEPAVSNEARVYLPLVEAWAIRTETGDRAEIGELPDEVSFWSDISAASDTCLGSACPQLDECFVTRMRQRALEADVVIVNHHLLCADAAVRQHSFGQVIPDCATAIIDEAHQLEEIATHYFGLSVSTFRIDRLIRDGRRLVEMQGDADALDAGPLGAALDDVRARSRAFFEELTWKLRVDGVSKPAGGRLFEDRVRLHPATLEPLLPAGDRLVQALGEVRAASRRVAAPTEDLEGFGQRAAEIAEQLEFLLRLDDPGHVYFVEHRGRGVFLRAAPIDVADIVRELLLDRMSATVLTSATLCVDEEFGYVRSRLGIGPCTELRLPSEFDYASQAILYLPPNMPDPRSAAFAEHAGREAAEILRRTAGRAFVLCTSHAGLREIQARLAVTVPYPLFVQGTAPRSELINQFRAKPNAVLIATSSFWQGVDVTGDALSCVIIDKLPFASPSEPITAARVEAIAARGGEPFAEYQVPLAILTLLQGLGRLIRHRQDRGVLAILDPRLRTKGYGRRFLAALPPAPVTEDVDAIARFLAS